MYTTYSTHGATGSKLVGFCC